MLHTIRFYSLAFAVILLMGCQKETLTTRVGSVIRIEMHELRDSAERRLELQCRTEKIYSAYNFDILHTVSVVANKIEISFTGISEPYINLNALGPARAEIDLGSLPDGVYQLTLQVDNRKSEGYLTVTPDYYEISLHKAAKVKIITPTLQRVP